MTTSYKAKRCCLQCGSCLCKPLRIFWYTFKNWWVPRISFLLWLIIILVLLLGVKLDAIRSVVDLNENLSARFVLWYIIDLLSMVMVNFYVYEWIEDVRRSGTLPTYFGDSRPYEGVENFTNSPAGGNDGDPPPHSVLVTIEGTEKVLRTVAGDGGMEYELSDGGDI